MLARGRQGVRMGVTVDENTFSSWGIENATKRALQASGKFIPWSVVTISTDGRIIY